VQSVDAVVIGAGPNGLVAANALADFGWDVLLLEANECVGGAVRSGEITAPGFTSDLFSAFYPLAAASRVIKNLHLEAHGLSWVQADAVLAHALPDGRAAVLSRAPEATARVTAKPGSTCLLAGTRFGTRCWTPCSRRFLRFGRCCDCCAGSAPPAPLTWPGWRCCRCAVWRRRTSPASVRRCC